tara:strand:+ start:489 stop:2144 length:1656 start_codon:yes stop_codon:yes gene_type:complete
MAYIGNQPAETPVKEILETDIKIGEDDQTKIDFADANKINFHANNAKEMVLVENALTPGGDDGTALGTTALKWSDLFLASGGVMNFNNGNVTLTHSADTLTVVGATVAFTASTAVTVSNDLKLVSDSAILSLGADDDATLTHDGTTGLTIAATPISIDSTGSLDLNSTTGDINLQDGGVNQIAFDLDGTAGEVIIKPMVDSDDLVIKQYDGTEVIRIEDDASLGLVGNKLNIANSSGDVIIKPLDDEKDIIFQQRDGTEVARIEDNATFNVVTDKLAINGTAVTATAAELNLIDGGTSVGGSVTVADSDGFILNDGGTMKTIPASDVKTYAGGSGGAYSLVSSTNFGASSTMTHAFSNIFTEENANYRIYLQMGQYNQSGTPFPYLRLYTDTGTTEGSTVRYHGRSVGSGAVSTETNLGTGNSAGSSGDEWSMICATDTNAGVIQGDDFPAYHAVIDIFNARHTTGTSQTTNRDRVTSISCHGGYMDMAGYFKQFSFELHMDEAQELFGFGIHTSKYYPDSDGALGTNLHGSNNPTEGMAGQFDLYKISVT